MFSKGAFTGPPIAAADRQDFVAEMKRQLADYKIAFHLLTDNKVDLSNANEDDECFQCLCPGCAQVPFTFLVIFTDTATEGRDTTSRFNMPQHKLNEISSETARVLAVIQGLVINATSGSAKQVREDPGLRTWKVSFKKEGSLGLGVDQMPGKWKITRVAANDPNNCLSKFNERNPESAVQVGDYITEINGVSPSKEGLVAFEEGATMTLTLETSRDAPPAQETMI